MRLTCQAIQGLTPLCSTIDRGKNGSTLRTEDFTDTQEPVTHAMNEVILHRGRSPHLTMLNISIDGVFLTEAIVSPL
jgi:NAD kinase